MMVFDTFQKVIFLDVDDEQGKLAEKDLQDTYGENHVTFLKCDVTKGAEFQSMKLELSLASSLSITFDASAWLHLKQYGFDILGVMKKISEQNNGINIFCNNAGILDNEDWRRMIDINLVGLR